MNEPHNILVSVKSLYLMDTILAIPALRAISHRYPEAQITLLSGPAAKELLRGCPYVHHHLLRQVTTRRQSDFALAHQLRAARYDTAVLFNRSFSSALMAFLGGVPERVGFDTEKRGALLTRRVPQDHTKHEIDRLLDIAAAIGAPSQGRETELWITDEDRYIVRTRMMNEFSDMQKPILLLQPDSHEVETKRWHTDRYIAAAAYLRDQYGFQIFVLGRDIEADTAKHMTSELGGDTINLVGKIRLRETLIFMTMIDLLLGCDSGLMHAAIALKTPTVSIFAPHRVTQWGYDRGINRLVVTPLQPNQALSPVTIRAALDAITVDDVIARAREVIEVHRAQQESSTEAL